VALLVRSSPADLEILLIERPASESDPWSGHMAFPGGRKNPGEDDLDAAIRETHEEVGVDLNALGYMLGRLDDLWPRPGGPQIAVAPFVFAVPGHVRLQPRPSEVAKTVWIPLGHIASPAAAAEHLYILPDGDRLRFPAIEYHTHVIWGLTYRMLMQFLEIVRTVERGEDH
jgi:8-oxo-dGTP pyrophosphatase MutT (NUDIX family)